MLASALNPARAASTGDASTSAKAGVAIVDFAREVQPIFEKHCVQCHGPEKQKGGWRSDVRESALTEGDHSAPNILPGRSAESPLIRYVSGLDPDLVMPKKGERLSSTEIRVLSRWIDQGASWPDSANQAATSRLTSPLDWWSLRPLRSPALPAGSTDAAGALDGFIRQKLATAGLDLGPEADRRTLIRRVSFDLTGLPPTADDIDAFIQDPDPHAYEKLVDRLLASPRYGERWARHWLDVVHYGDTHGYDKDKPRENAWPYRDYVIRAFNEDKPYARFVEEQLAGDVLFPGTLDGVDALGFIAAGPWDLIGHTELPESKIDGKIARHLDRDDMVANTIGTFTSVTVHCAQCHNHKFDPIKQDDYYALQAVFAGVDRADKEFLSDPTENAQLQTLRARQLEIAQLRKAIEQRAEKVAHDALQPVADRLGELGQKGKSLKEAEKAEQAELRTRRSQLMEAATTPEDRALRTELDTRSQAVQADLDHLPKPHVVYAGTIYSGIGNFVGTGPDGGKPRPIHVLARGQVTAPGVEVGPGALSVLTFSPARFALPADASEGQRRAALAQWIVHPDNPLTWRSIVNRVWQYHFGRGLVDTPSDFGRNGAQPSHPELLDWLAAEFRDTGGSFKQLHRRMVLSATYRQGVRSDARAEEIDRDNGLYWRQNRRKLEAEAVRDAVLATSGTLDLTMGGPGWKDFVVTQPEHSPHYEYDRADPHDPSVRRRAIYRFIVRSQTQPFLTSLDCADPSLRVDKRNEGLSPLQALALLNNGFMLVQAAEFARSLEAAQSAPAARVEEAYRRAFGRRPQADERAAAGEFVAAYGLANFCRVLFNLNEFQFVD